MDLMDEFVTDYRQLIRELLSKNLYITPPSAFVGTFGCAGNLSDSAKIKYVLISCGYKISDSEDNADVIIYNTCAVRETAENKVFGRIGQLVHLKRRNPSVIIGICGCMTQQKEAVGKIKKSYPFVDFVLGTGMASRIPKVIHGILHDHTQKIYSEDPPDVCTDINIPSYTEDNIKALVPIMYGCNNFCSYCIVPYVRGRERSRPPGSIMEEIRQLAESGTKEITLLGQNVNSYFAKNSDGTEITFPKLLRLLNSLSGDFKIRFLTSHPKDATCELFDTMAECSRIYPHIHLPIQSGSNRILKLMNRNYTREHYLALVGYARKKIPDISFSTDIIVGFPGESRTDFEQTLQLLREIRCVNLYSFIYSRRTGTKAAELKPTESCETISLWMRELLELQGNIGLEHNVSLVGSRRTVLFDKALWGRDQSNITVKPKFEKETAEIQPGIFYEAEIIGANKTSLTATDFRPSNP